jgi:hypothetical protein
MTTFTIEAQNTITAFSSPEAARGASATRWDTFTDPPELAALAASWPAHRLVAIWNRLAGVTPVHKFTDRKTAVHRIWTRIQRLGESMEPKVGPSAKPNGEPQATSGAGGPGCPRSGRVGKEDQSGTENGPAPKGGASARSIGATCGEQAQARCHAVRDHAEDGVAEAYGERIHGGCDEESRLPSGVLLSPRAASAPTASAHSDTRLPFPPAPVPAAVIVAPFAIESS